MNKDWMNNKDNFMKADVRGVAGNFFPGLKQRAMKLSVGQGLEVIQTFEPLPLYDVMEELGYDHVCEKTNDHEYHVWFYRTAMGEDKKDIPMRPAAITNFPMVDNDLGEIAVNFWDLTWNDDRRHLPYEMRLLLSLTNAVGAGRMRQASRELIKAYIHGLDSAALDDVFELLAWNQGIGYFSSEIGTSVLFQAYKYIKTEEKKGTDRSDICDGLLQKFGEKHPDVKVQ